MGGDEEPCPVGATTAGPISAKSSMAFSDGDTDCVDDGSEEHGVHDDKPDDDAPLLVNCAQNMVKEDIDRLERLAAEIGLRLPNNSVSPRVTPAMGGLEKETSAPMPELTGEMLSGLSAFLHGSDP